MTKLPLFSIKNPAAFLNRDGEDSTPQQGSMRYILRSCSRNKLLRQTPKYLQIYSLSRCLPKVFQNAASCVAAKLMRIKVLGWLRLAWKSAPGASK